ncbi:ABC-type uncharacterized transport system auxiliary subunit [Litorimonas taeanensis]|uniref:ABC-type uncharacterized transport system auxiliary subunit n=1 Tax=Litorimonas taeanensis TaxID=568099 RepID=A0A420WJM8_9PROT|nr:ABC-type transport auxiliary lipoprotein family protein [Litorimonas taeanensis]RKQ71115.1 ABC-type uncharacterized transport system auxiliary subunit [Litorimonas taeanensis]
MMKSIRLGAFLLSAPFLAHCNILPDPAPADTIYRLGSIPMAVTADSDAHVIRVDRPSAPMIFQTRDVVVSPDGQRLATAAQARWAEAMPILVQTAFIDVLASNTKLIGVMPISGARTDTRVQLSIKNFEAQFDQGENKAPLAVVAFSVTFANASNRNLLGTYDVRKEYRASAASVSAIVDAISKANVEALADVADWLEKQPAHKLKS